MGLENTKLFNSKKHLNKLDKDEQREKLDEKNIKVQLIITLFDYK